MKYNKLKYWLLCTIIFLVSCKKLVGIDPPKTSLVSETVFQNNDQATAAVLGMYTNMRTTFFAIGQGSISISAGFSSDELIYYNNPSYALFYENQLTPQFSGVQNIYFDLYKTIFYANSIIDGLGGSNGVTPPVRQQLEGEAFFIRAFCHFYLVNLFGEIPLQLTSDFKITSVASRSTVNQIYSQIVADLKLAEDKLLDAYPTTGKVRPNKSVAQSMLARTYLYMQDYDNAEKYATLVIDKAGTYGLTDYDSIFLGNSKEAIWQLELPLNTTTLDGSLFIPANFTSIPSTVSLRNSFALSAFETGDKRKDSWVKSFTIPAGTTYYYPYKYKVRNSTVLEYSTVFRLAEQYLIRAEARINGGKTQTGIADLNIIRQRPLSTGINANMLAPLLTTLNKQDALSAVGQERKVELFSEWGHRWFDLKRTGMANAELSLIKSSWKTTAQLYPIPQFEISNNSRITQNPGY